MSILVAASILALCLWHLPLEKVPILKELVPAEKGKCCTNIEHRVTNINYAVCFESDLLYIF
ncbi:MAG: hypothetical protein ACR5KV_04465 [Wolbachia sp.]